MRHLYFQLLSTLPLVIIGLIGCESIEPIPIKNSPLSEIPSSNSNAPSSLTDPAFLEALEEATHREINRYRLSKNLSPLKLNSQITQQARIHSERMASGIIPISHDKLEERLKIISYSTPHEKGVENLATHQDNFDPVEATIKQWLNHPQNLKNIEGKYDETGIGVAQNNRGEYYFTQIFIKDKPSNITHSPEITNSLEPWKNSDLLLEKASQDGQFLIALEQEINRRVNQYRLSKNLPPLTMNAEISYVAREHSQDMASKQATFSHDGFDNRAKSVGKTIPYQSFAENLAYIKGYPDLADVAVKGWINSPGHRKNMEGNFNLTGIGIAKNSEGEYYFTQLFLLQR
ncbi:CAP domain-containing protein [Crocosphaera chwakensis]|uniref:Allergen V5/Tpx-1 related protein n=1 Tax=Crocosphaera chwakensis CCY0110 TaxID=391612 RepID=A3IMF4_9CHRO|nr:CAP domain-containing protein [Crocosphaera chwakensis]EAZ92323.1 Allergen V5/Tpx-1 related protein [Crocosphaera chwakensis CCY0110]